MTHTPTRTLALAATLLMGPPAATSPSPLAAQTVVESPAPRYPDLVLADEPLVRIGVIDGPVEYIFGDVTGAIRLEDGGVVIVDEQSHNVRRYDAGGRHVWTSGQAGEGPGDFGGLRLVPGCRERDQGVRLAKQPDHRARSGRESRGHAGAPTRPAFLRTGSPRARPTATWSSRRGRITTGP